METRLKHSRWARRMWALHWEPHAHAFHPWTLHQSIQAFYVSKAHVWALHREPHVHAFHSWTLRQSIQAFYVSKAHVWALHREPHVHAFHSWTLRQSIQAFYVSEAHVSPPLGATRSRISLMDVTSVNSSILREQGARVSPPPGATRSRISLMDVTSVNSSILRERGACEPSTGSHTFTHFTHGRYVSQFKHSTWARRTCEPSTGSHSFTHFTHGRYVSQFKHSTWARRMWALHWEPHVHAFHSWTLRQSIQAFYVSEAHVSPPLGATRSRISLMDVTSVNSSILRERGARVSPPLGATRSRISLVTITSVNSSILRERGVREPCTSTYHGVVLAAVTRVQVGVVDALAVPVALTGQRTVGGGPTKPARTHVWLVALALYAALLTNWLTFAAKRYWVLVTSPTHPDISARKRW